MDPIPTRTVTYKTGERAGDRAVINAEDFDLTLHAADGETVQEPRDVVAAPVDPPFLTMKIKDATVFLRKEKNATVLSVYREMELKGPARRTVVDLLDALLEDATDEE